MDVILLEKKTRQMVALPAGYSGPVEVLLGPVLYAVCKDVEEAVSIMIKVLMNNPNAQFTV